LLDAYSYQGVLERGYADGKRGAVIEGVEVKKAAPKAKPKPRAPTPQGDLF